MNWLADRELIIGIFLVIIAPMMAIAFILWLVGMPFVFCLPLAGVCIAAFWLFVERKDPY